MSEDHKEADNFKKPGGGLINPQGEPENDELKETKVPTPQPMPEDHRPGDQRKAAKPSTKPKRSHWPANL
jgi:hypothetical protein